MAPTSTMSRRGRKDLLSDAEKIQQAADATGNDPMVNIQKFLAEFSGEQKALLDELTRAAHTQGRQPIHALRNAYLPVDGFKHPFKSFGQFLKSVHSCSHNGHISHNPLMEAYYKALPAGMNETVGADGGYLVPPQYSQNLLMRMYENDLLSRTNLFTLTESNTLKLPAINETSRADGSRQGGIRAYWRGEAESVTASKPSLEQITLTLDSLMLTVETTTELLQDTSGRSLEQYINMLAPQELQFKIGDAIVNGDGVKKMTGIMNSPAKVVVSKELGQPAGTINANNVLKMWSRMFGQCRSDAVWLIDQTCEPLLATMTIGTGGANMLVYQPAGALASTPHATLMGRPVISTEFNQQVGTQGDIILFSPSQYVSITAGGMQAASSMHVLFLTAEMMYRFTYRVDGKPWWLAALTPKNGGPTQSPIVTLETRS